MTACSNNRRHGAVVAALVGAMSLGAPAVALAANGGVEMLVAPEVDAFSRGAVKLSGGGVSKVSTNNWTAQAEADGSALGINAFSVTPLGGKEIELEGNDDYKVSFFKADAEGNPEGNAIESIVEPGNYVVVVEALGGDYAGGKATAKLAVKAADLTGIYYFDEASEGTADKTLIYNGSELEVGFACSGSVELTEGVDYSVKILKKGTDNVESAPSVAVKDAGDYVAYVTGLGQFEGETAEVAINVQAFSFAHATIETDDVIGSNSAPSHPTRVYSGTGDTYVELDPSLVSLEFKGGFAGEAAGSDLFDKIGGYTFVASVDESNKSLTNTADRDVTVNKVAAEATFEYDGKAISDSYFINLAKDESFNPSAIKVYNGDVELTPNVDFEATVTDALGTSKLDELTANVPGTYYVSVRVKPEGSKANYQVGGSVTFTVKVVKDVVDADANVFVYDKATGQAITSYSKSYDGKTVKSSDFTVKAFDADGNLLSNSDFTRTLVDSEGNEVSGNSVTDAGEYTLKITSDAYELTGTTELPVTISKVDLSELRVGGLVTKAGGSYLPALGTAYNWAQLGLQYNTHELDADGNEVWADLDGSWSSQVDFERYDSEKGEWVKDNSNLGKVEGSWRAVLRGTSTDAKNYDFATDDNETVVEFKCVDADKLVYEDVNPEKWYVDPVYEAKQQEYLTGYSGTKLFGPEDTITRGQVACVLFNMAGGKYGSDGDFGYTEGFGYDTGFSDVDGTKYYGQAIAWAHASGVVNGSDGEFRPDDAVTREEFVAMLANYAELKGEDVEGAEADLSAFADASEVSGWAAESVEWAVSQKVMGNGGYIGASSTITRAEAAAMAVNYQPNKLA